jgi:hypothetical protein
MYDIFSITIHLYSMIHWMSVQGEIQSNESIRLFPHTLIMGSEWIVKEKAIIKSE